MSASTVARWNSIPMERPWDGPSTSFKRRRSPASRSHSSPDTDSEDDDVSLVSRSPSPEASNRRGGDADSDVHMYDEHSDVRGVARERITVDTKISSSNRGFAMLAKMGWTEGKPVGISGDGRTEPVPFTLKYDASGLGKARQDFEVIETTVSQRKTLDSERMQNETAEQRQQREAAVAQKAAVASEVSQTLRAFYCEYCDKQFANVAQYDEHTNSYAHHHKVRAKDMASHHPVRAAGKEEADKRKEKERKREEKELRKIAKAAGIKISAVPGTAKPSAPENASKEAKKSGWASVGSGETQPATSSASNGGGAWATVSTPAPPAAPRTAARQGGTSAPSANAPEALAKRSPPTNAFRSGGFTTLQTSITQLNPLPVPPPPPPTATNLSSQPTPPAPGPPISAPPPPPPSFQQPPPSSSIPTHIPPPPIPSSVPSFSPPGFSSSQPPLPPSHSPAPSPSTFAQPTSLPQAQPQLQADSISAPPPLGAVGGTEKKTKVGKKRRDAEAEEPQSRGNWQSFQRGRGRR